MAAVNDITGKEIKSKILSKNGRNNWDKIFSKKTAYEWAEIDNIKIKDDGWDTPDMPIKYTEFLEKLSCGSLTVI